MPQAERKNILLLGGAGFLGSHLAEALIKDNNVICIDNFLTSEQSNIEHLLKEYSFVFINADVNESIDLEKYKELEKFNVKFKGVQEIYNLACPTAPKDFEENVINTCLSNSKGTINALDLAVKYKAKLMHFSSSVVYGPHDETERVVSEDSYSTMDPLTPRACYDEGKKFSETLVYTYRRKYNLDAKIARVFRTYGPRMMLGQGHMILEFIIHAIEDKPLIVYGDKDWSTSLCYIDDMVEGVLKFMDSPEMGPVNLGSEVEIKMSDVAKKVIELVGSKSEVQYEAPLMFMSPLKIPNIALAKDKVNWFPILTLDKGLEKTIEYVKVHKVLTQWKNNKK